MKDRLKEIRNHIGKSQQKLADDLGVSLSNIQSYELGRRTPSEAFIHLICSKYNINENWLRTGEGEMLAPMDRETEIAQITAQMFKAEESDFRYQLQKLIYEMSEEQIELLKDFAVKLSQSLKEK